MWPWRTGPESKALKKVEEYWKTARSNLKQNAPSQGQTAKEICMGVAHICRWAATEVRSIMELKA